MGNLIDRQWDPDAVSEIRDAVPRGNYRCKLREVESVYTNKQPPRLMYVAQHDILEPEDYAGARLFDRFTIGTDNDPEAEDPESWSDKSFAVKRIKEMCTAFGVASNRSVAKMLRGAIGREALAFVVQPQEDQNEVKRYYPLNGDRRAGVATGAASREGAAARRGAPKARAPEETRVAGTTVRRAAAPAHVTCRICGENVATKEYQAHVQEHNEEE